MGTSVNKVADERRARYALEDWAIRQTLARVDREATILARAPELRSASGSVDWRFLLSFSLDRIQSTIKSTTLVIWSLVTTIAISPWRGNKLARSMEAEPEHDELLRKRRQNADGRRQNVRDPWLVSELSYFPVSLP